MTTSYVHAPDVKAMADEIIAKVDEHSALQNAEIRYVWRLGDPAKSKGKLVYGKASKVTGRAAFLARAQDPDLGFFVIEMSDHLWRFLDDDQRRALIDHELSHCKVFIDDDDEKSYAVVGHDVEEFHGVVRRHGDWRPEITTLREVAGQGRLDLSTPTESRIYSRDGDGQPTKVTFTSDDAGALDEAAEALKNADLELGDDHDAKAAAAIQRGNEALAAGDVAGARRAVADVVNIASAKLGGDPVIDPSRL